MSHPTKGPGELETSLARRARDNDGVFAHVELHPVVDSAGPRARRRYVEFFTAEIRNRNTRRAYARAVHRFLDWCELRGIGLLDLEPVVVAAYVERLGYELAPASVKQHLAAVRMFLDYLVTGHVLEHNPAAPVRGPKHVVETGKTPVLLEDEAKAFLAAIDETDLIGLRDRALVGLMVYTFARVGAATRMRIKDFEVGVGRAWVVLHEKGGRFHRTAAHHRLVELLTAYLERSRIRSTPEAPLFQTFRGRSGQLTGRPMSQPDVFRMIRRRARRAGFATELCCHTFRGTGITNYLSHGGDLEKARQMAAHSSSRTTQLYNRRREEISLDEVEKIKI
jgi:site-specific recombinase XerD